MIDIKRFFMFSAGESSRDVLPPPVANIHKSFPVVKHLWSQRKHRARYIRDNTKALHCQADSTRLAQKIYRKRHAATGKRRVRELLMDCYAEAHKSMLRGAALLQMLSIVDFMQAQYILENANWTLYLQHCMNALVTSKTLADGYNIAFAPIQPALGLQVADNNETSSDKYQQNPVDDVSAYMASLQYLACFLAHDEDVSREITNRISNKTGGKQSKGRHSQKKSVIVSTVRHVGVVLRQTAEPAPLSPVKNHGKKKGKDARQSVKILDSRQDLLDFAQQRGYVANESSRLNGGSSSSACLYHPATLTLTSTAIEWLGDEIFEGKMREDESIDTVVPTYVDIEPVGRISLPQLMNTVTHRLSTARLYYCVESRDLKKAHGPLLQQLCGSSSPHHDGKEHSLVKMAEQVCNYISATYSSANDPSTARFFDCRGTCAPFIVKEQLYNHMRLRNDACNDETGEGADFAGEFPPILKASSPDTSVSSLHFAPAMVKQLLECCQFAELVSQDMNQFSQKLEELRTWFGDQCTLCNIVDYLYVVVDKGTSDNPLWVLYPISTEAVHTLLRTYLFGESTLFPSQTENRLLNNTSDRDSVTVEVAVPFHRTTPAIADTIDAWVSQLQESNNKKDERTSMIRPLNSLSCKDSLVADSLLFRLKCDINTVKEKIGYIVFTSDTATPKSQVDQEIELRVSPWLPSYLLPGDPSHGGLFDISMYRKNRSCCHWRACLRSTATEATALKEEPALVQLRNILPEPQELRLCDECKRTKTSLMLEYMASRKSKQKGGKQKDLLNDSVPASEVPELQRYLPRMVKSSIIGIFDQAYPFHRPNWSAVLSTDLTNPRGETDEVWTSYVRGIFSLPSWTTLPNGSSFVRSSRTGSIKLDTGTESLCSLAASSSWLTQELLSEKLRSTIEGFFAKLKYSQHPPKHKSPKVSKKHSKRNFWFCCIIISIICIRIYIVFDRKRV